MSGNRLALRVESRPGLSARLPARLIIPLLESKYEPCRWDRLVSLKRVSLRAGPYTFSHVTYDPPSDVLYAAIGGPRPGSRERTPECHYLRFDAGGRFSGIILMSPREQLEREGGVYVSLPQGDRVRVQGIEAFVRETEQA
jgi:hypothetical protein